MGRRNGDIARSTAHRIGASALIIGRMSPAGERTHAINRADALCRERTAIFARATSFLAKRGGLSDPFGKVDPNARERFGADRRPNRPWLGREAAKAVLRDP